MHAKHNRIAFEDRLIEILSGTGSGLTVGIPAFEIDYDALTNLYVEVENFFQDELAKRVIRNTTLGSFLRFPSLSLKAAAQFSSFGIRAHREKRWKHSKRAVA